MCGFCYILYSLPTAKTIPNKFGISKKPIFCAYNPNYTRHPEDNILDLKPVTGFAYLARVRVTYVMYVGMHANASVQYSYIPTMLYSKITI